MTMEAHPLSRWRQSPSVAWLAAQRNLLDSMGRRGTVGAAATSGVKALWAISKGLGNFEGKILEMLAHHQNTLEDHEERLRAGKL
jgi:hypothetical protein